MPAKVVKRKNKFRLIHEIGRRRRLIKNSKGKPVDGGGHSSRSKALRQAAAINR